MIQGGGGGNYAIFFCQPGRVAQSVASLTQEPHTFVSPSADSNRSLAKLCARSTD